MHKKLHVYYIHMICVYTLGCVYSACTSSDLTWLAEEPPWLSVDHLQR